MRILNLILIIIVLLTTNTSIAGRCTGGANCTACTNCSSCQNYSENGGTCCVCSNNNESYNSIDSNSYEDQKK